MSRFKLFHPARRQSTDEKLDTIIANQREIVARLIRIEGKEVKIMAEIDDLEARVAAEETVIASSNKLLGDLKTALDAALAGNDADLRARVAALATKIGADTDSISAAVVANTPAAAESGGAS